MRMRVVRMKLVDESVELTEDLAPRRRPFPIDTRSNDRWFQHVAIIVSDMDRAYRTLRQVQHASSGPQRLPDWNKSAGASKPSISGILMAISLKSCDSRRARVIPSGSVPTSCFSELITQRLSYRTPKRV
jgi:hypothetical protein